MERKDPSFAVERHDDIGQLLAEVQQGLDSLIRALESGKWSSLDPEIKNKLMQLDGSSRHFLALVQQMASFGRMHSGSSEDYDKFKVHYRFTQQIDLLIEKNLDDHKFGVHELSRAMGMSRSQIHRKLTALTKQSANCYIRNYRLHRAARLLRESVFNVSDIAYQVGFGSQTYFSKCFREIFLMSPTSYRKTFESVRKKLSENGDCR